VVTLRDLLRRYLVKHIDILDVDVEGHELAVWGSLDLSVLRPSLVIIEYADNRPESSCDQICGRLTGDGYELVHRTPANLLFQCRRRPLERRRMKEVKSE
jgi:hypothetical protein